MKHLVIIGGGHAGSSAALGAARHRCLIGKEKELTITLINQTPFLGIRPRYYEYELEQTQVKLTEFLEPINVNVVVGTVENIDFKDNQIFYEVEGKISQLSYDALILAMGSQLINPNIPGIKEFTHNVDTYIFAKKLINDLQQAILENDLNNLLRIVVLGGGLTGIEVATELPITIQKICQKYAKPNIPFQISIIDRHEIVNNLGNKVKPYLEDALNQSDIKCINNATIKEITPHSVIYNQDSEVKYDLVISTLGIRANPLSQKFPFNKDNLGRIKVNQFLQIPKQDSCFAAGDIAVTKVDAIHDSVMSCQHGRPQGRYAGHNAVAMLFNKDMLIYQQPNYVTCVDLGVYGAVYTEGWDREVKLYGVGAKKIKRFINCDRIYPNKALEKDHLFNVGDPKFTAPLNELDLSQIDSV